MTKRIVSIVACLALTAVGASPVRAYDHSQGNRCAIAIGGLPDDLYNCQPVSMTVTFELYDDGTNHHIPVVFTTWVATPFGHAILSERMVRVFPGQTIQYSVAFAYHCNPGEQTGESTRLVVGVTATIKSESVHATHSVTYHDALPPQE